MSFSTGSSLGSAARDSRRRRLLADERDSDEETASTTTSRWGNNPSAKASRYYGEASFLEEQRRLIDFVPRRKLAWFGLLFLGMILLAGIEWLYYVAKMGGWFEKGLSLEALDLTSARSLTRWIESLMLLGASWGALGVYSIRRHREDDYPGRYRIWPIAAIFCFFLASEFQMQLHVVWQQYMVKATGTLLWSEGVLWWLLPSGFIALAIGFRIMLDLGRSYLAWFSCLMTILCYSASLGLHFQWLVIEHPLFSIMAQAGAVLLGHLFLFMTMLAQARYVLLDAEGLIEHPETSEKSEPKPKKKKKASTKATEDKKEDKATEKSTEKTSTTSGGWNRVDTPSSIPQPVSAMKTSSGFGTLGSSLSSTNSSASVPKLNRPLTKQEKKVLKEKLVKERLEREQKQAKAW